MCVPWRLRVKIELFTICKLILTFLASTKTCRNVENFLWKRLQEMLRLKLPFSEVIKVDLGSK